MRAEFKADDTGKIIGIQIKAETELEVIAMTQFLPKYTQDYLLVSDLGSLPIDGRPPLAGVFPDLTKHRRTVNFTIRWKEQECGYNPTTEADFGHTEETR